MKRKSESGFTLLELLLVVTILGILAGAALPRLFPQSEKGRVAEALNILSAIRQGEEAFALERGTYTWSNLAPVLTWENIGMTDPNAGSRYFTYDVLRIGPEMGPLDFLARATRTTVSDPNSLYRTRTITIDQDGAYGGTHPYVPPNPS